MLCSKYNTANYCPVPLIKISIRKYGTYALTNSPHSPQDKAKNFSKNSAHQLHKTIKIRLYSKQFISLLAMSAAKRWTHVTWLHQRRHRAGGGRCSSTTRRAKIKWRVYPRMDTLGQLSHFQDTTPASDVVEYRKIVNQLVKKTGTAVTLAISHHFPYLSTQITLIPDHGWRNQVTGHQERKKEEKRQDAHLYCNHGYNSGLILNFAQCSSVCGMVK